MKRSCENAEHVEQFCQPKEQSTRTVNQNSQASRSRRSCSGMFPSLIVQFMSHQPPRAMAYGTLLTLLPYRTQPRVESLCLTYFVSIGRACKIRAQVSRPLSTPNNHLMLVRRGPHRRSNNSNMVQLKELIAGRDCRTTVLLRNTPNKVDQPMLERIDFANECNVGYAFINFTKAEYIIPFMHDRASSRWNCYKREEISEVSYATIQRRRELLQE
ncbi:hypothetical protein FZEAL_6611 [Fusarium zealandicum]|uniref:Mei2-like C-terminal RNA recognition motif domain-containing protein n=1 Tax=Fusarium zealandicum TaxID=1053134 RepID=A0A8H4XJQ6_9HYPO|nr:hypothetical protein FZEAL_6611 [Fusarium zealandicum]